MCYGHVVCPPMVDEISSTTAPSSVCAHSGRGPAGGPRAEPLGLVAPGNLQGMTVARTLRTGLALTAGAGAAALAWASMEAQAYTLRRFEVPVLAPGSRPMSILHLSDLHLLARQRCKQQWIAGLAGLEPDLVVNTGDNTASADAWPYVVSALGRLLDKPGVFVHGSNDYYAPKAKSWLRYLDRDRRTNTGAAQIPSDADERELPWRELDAAFVDHGWTRLTQAESVIEVAGQRILLRGTDDAHLGLDNYGAVAGPRPEGISLQIGVTHAPYLRVLDAMVADGTDLILAGHTHGGQVCIPGFGALVTNCDLDTPRVKGVSRHVHDGRVAELHVCAGLGTSPYAPIRFACRPEAALLRLVPRAG